MISMAGDDREDREAQLKENHPIRQALSLISPFALPHAARLDVGSKSRAS
jgi:hypothetical protein